MPAKDNPKTEGQTNEAPEAARGSDMHGVLTTLDQVFSTFRTQLRDEAPKPFDGAAKIAVDAFNDIVAGLKFNSLPDALKIAARPISLTEIELTWTDDIVNADGYKIKRCQGQYCQDFIELGQLLPSARFFRDVNLSGNITYRYQLVAFNARGETPSNIVNVTPATRRDEK
ncbi:MAG: fibronectin type III domain-containing protein [Desulfobacterales bacterium]